MTDYVESMLKECSHKILGRSEMPWAENSLNAIGSRRKRNISHICNEEYDFV